jgi:prolyl-tRNA editing enzyme YbaK/EbsC (Cys-tRNA(Pro) deacylase)
MVSASAVLTSSSVERVRQALQHAGMDVDIVELPGAARTAKAAADFLGCEVAQIANSLVFRAEASDSAVLVMSSGAQRVDTQKLGKLVGESIGKADADFVRRHLSAYGELWAAGGHPHTVFRLSYRELLRITGGLPAELAI